MRNLKKIILSLGLALTSISILTACNTVQGAAEGAGKDIKAVSNAIDGPSHKKTHSQHKQVTKSTTTTDQSTNSQTTTQSTSGTDKSY